MTISMTVISLPENAGPFVLISPGDGVEGSMQVVGSLPLLIEDDVEIWAKVDGRMKKIRDAIGNEGGEQVTEDQ